jgi:hypothetical protein
MAEVYVRRLNPTEVDRHYIFIDVDHRKMFPPPGKRFKIRVNAHEIEAKVDKFYRVHISMKVKGTLNIKENNVVIFTKNPDGTYSLVSRREK